MGERDTNPRAVPSLHARCRAGQHHHCLTDITTPHHCLGVSSRCCIPIRQGQESSIFNLPELFVTQMVVRHPQLGGHPLTRGQGWLSALGASCTPPPRLSCCPPAAGKNQAAKNNARKWWIKDHHTHYWVTYQPQEHHEGVGKKSLILCTMQEKTHFLACLSVKHCLLRVAAVGKELHGEGTLTLSLYNAEHMNILLVVSTVSLCRSFPVYTKRKTALIPH